MQETQAIQLTKDWIEQIVIGCHFCPFAAKPFFEGNIRYQVCRASDFRSLLQNLESECRYLDHNPETETSLLILTEACSSFSTYLELLALAEKKLHSLHYRGIYQLASFHPQYCFAGSQIADPANYTNRSPLPMLHLLREASITRAIRHFEAPERIPERNMAFAREKGADFFKR